MQTASAYNYLMSFGDELAADDAYVSSLYDRFYRQPSVSHQNREQVAARAAMAIIVCDSYEIDTEKQVYDSKFSKKSTKETIERHIYRYINSGLSRGGSGNALSLPLIGAAMLEMVEWTDLRWEQIVMITSGKFGFSPKISDPVVDLIDETEVEETVIIPPDLKIVNNHTEEFNNCSYLFGYPIWYGEDADGDLALRVRSFQGEGKNVKVEDFEIMIGEEHVKHLLKYVKDLDTYGPVRSEMMTFVLDPDNELWASYLSKHEKIEAETLLHYTDGGQLLQMGTGYNLGRTMYNYEYTKKWGLGIEYWGGVAKEPESGDQMHHARCSWSIRTDIVNGPRIDLFGNYLKAETEFIRCGVPTPPSGFRVMWLNANYENITGQIQPKLDELLSHRGEIKQLIQRSTKAKYKTADVLKWLKVIKIRTELREAFHAAVAADGPSVTAWRAAWALAKQCKGLDEIDTQQLAMAAGDLITMSDLIGNKAFAMDGMAWDF